MIVVAIIGILASVALGFYGDNVIASNRTEGRSALTQAANTLEKCRSLYGSYNHANCNYADFASESNFYNITGAIGATNFTLTATPVAGQPQSNDTDCTTMTLTNTGPVAGTETVQLYLGDPESSVPRPPRELVAFRKVALAPAASERVVFEIASRDLAFFSEATRSWVAEAGSFTVHLGASSRDLRLEGGFELLKDQRFALDPL